MKILLRGRHTYRIKYDSKDFVSRYSYFLEIDIKDYIITQRYLVYNRSNLIS
ncbi:hypothetical protein SKB0123_02590 [Staphylococcus capitis]|nr:hypothetical protein GCM10008141_13930 [Staphylococcus capitis]